MFDRRLINKAAHRPDWEITLRSVFLERFLGFQLVGMTVPAVGRRTDMAPGRRWAVPWHSAQIRGAVLMPAAGLDPTAGKSLPVAEVQVLDGLVGEIVTGAPKGNTQFWPRPRRSRRLPSLPSWAGNLDHAGQAAHGGNGVEHDNHNFSRVVPDMR